MIFKLGHCPVVLPLAIPPENGFAGRRITQKPKQIAENAVMSNSGQTQQSEVTVSCVTGLHLIATGAVMRKSYE